MIIINITGGLGNQMFEYATGLALSKFFDTNLKLDLNSLENRAPRTGFTFRSFELEEVFGIKQTNRATPKELQAVFDMPFGRKEELIHFLKYQITKYSIIDEYRLGFGFHDLKKIAKKNSYLNGKFQSEKYFSNYHLDIKKAFTFTAFIKEKNIKYHNLITNSNSVCLHIRRGDYANDPSINQHHGTCDLTYYENAISFISSKLADPYYFIFTDDHNWVKQNLKISSNHYFIEGNFGKNSYRDMQLMSICKHHIIANSTFSWWGAWLATNPEKIVIAPKKWFRDKNISSKDIIPSNWLKL